MVLAWVGTQVCRSMSFQPAKRDPEVDGLQERDRSICVMSVSRSIMCQVKG